MSTPVLEKDKPRKDSGNPRPQPPAASGPVTSRTDETYDNSDELPFFRRHRALIIIGVLFVGAALYFKLSPPSAPDTKPVRKAAVPINVQLPPPPPPPPPKVEQPKEEQMEEQTPVADETPPEPAPDNSPPPIGTNNVGNGPADGFGLGKSTGGGGTGTGRRVGGGSKYGYYASQVQNSINDALRRNGKTKAAAFSVTARIWADDTGRVTRAAISGSSGDPAVDAALQNEVLTGLQLSAPPPAGMKMPINLRLAARPSR